jgi:hypothetical protein
MIGILECLNVCPLLAHCPYKKIYSHVVFNKYKPVFVSQLGTISFGLKYQRKFEKEKKNI